MRKFVLRILCQVVFLGALAHVGAAQTAAPPSFEDLAARVQKYLMVREQVESSLPGQKSTKQSGRRAPTRNRETFFLLELA